MMTIEKLDELRDHANKMLEKRREAERAAEAGETPTTTPRDVARANYAVAMGAVKDALREWWRQGCKAPAFRVNAPYPMPVLHNPDAEALAGQGGPPAFVTPSLAMDTRVKEAVQHNDAYHGARYEEQAKTLQRTRDLIMERSNNIRDCIIAIRGLLRVVGPATENAACHADLVDRRKCSRCSRIDYATKALARLPTSLLSEASKVAP